MPGRKGQILEAAIQTISRYGVKRTSVSDIASEAGVARQTVYNAFADKNAILKATVNYLYAQTFDDIKAELKDSRSLARQLDVFFEHLAVKAYDLINSSPEAEDIVDGIGEAAKQEIERAHETARALIEKALRPHAKNIRASGLSVRDLSEFISSSLAHAKSNAKDRKHLTKLLTTLKVLVLNLAGDEAR